MYKVLLVDDEELVVESLEGINIWKPEGFEVVDHAFNGRVAYEKILLTKPDVVFTDIRMPKMNGLDLMRKFCNAEDAPLFVVISGYAEFSYAKQAITLGALGYCLKPFEPDEISKLLCSIKVKLDEKFNKTKEKKNEYVNEGIAPKDVDQMGGKVIYEIIQYIDRNFFKEISIHSISKDFFINPNYFCGLFKKTIGITFTEYITKCRITYAGDLLKNSNYSISEISQKVGYNNLYYFTKMFKRINGISPSQFKMTFPL